MSSSFLGLNTALSGLYASKTNLNVAAHNISNADTEGYSRQYSEQQASNAISDSSGYVGTGTTITSISSYRSEYLDQKYWSNNDEYGFYETKSDLMDEIETVFSGSDTDFTTYFDDVFDALETLSTDASSEVDKTSYVSSLVSLTEYINSLSDSLTDIQEEANTAVKTTVSQINSIAEQIATLNEQITTVEFAGDTANDLRDQRATLIDELSELVSVDVDTSDATGVEVMTIKINGQTLVSGSNVNELEVQERESLDNPEDADGLYDVVWSSTGEELDLSSDTISGSLKAYIDIRDGNNGENFTATYESGAGTTTLVVTDASRTDLSASGTITIDNVDYDYDSYTVEVDSDGNATGRITFELSTASSSSLTSDSTCEIGESNTYKGVAYYIQQLNDFARTLAESMNELQESGDDGTGVSLLVYDGYSGSGLDTTDSTTYNQITAANLTVNEEIQEDVDLVMTKYSSEDGDSANDLLLDMVALKDDESMFSQGSPEEFMQALISQVAIDTSTMDSFADSQEQMMTLIENQRLSVSDVDTNEEAISLVQYQQTYNLSAQVITVFDEIYDVTINSMGV